MRSVPCLTLLLLVFCNQSTPRIDKDLAKPENQWLFEGWACAPDLSRSRMRQSPLDYCDFQKKEELNYLYGKVAIEAEYSSNPDQLVKNCTKVGRSKIQGARLMRFMSGQCMDDCIPEVGCLFKGLKATDIGRREIYGCCPMSERGLCQKQASEQCVCVIAMEFPRGEDTFSTR